MCEQSEIKEIDKSKREEELPRSVRRVRVKALCLAATKIGRFFCLSFSSCTITSTVHLLVQDPSNLCLAGNTTLLMTTLLIHYPF